MFKRIIFILFTIGFFFPLTGTAQFYQGAQMTFGKNRVQYNDFYWTYFRFKNFDTYFYVGGKEVAEYIGKNAQPDIDEVEKLFDYRSNARFQFIVYNKLSDLKQTNIGLESADEQSYNIGGITRIVGNKILIYFNGDHAFLHQQIRTGIAQVLFDQLMYGGNIKERLQASILLNLPDWYVKGLTSYIGRGWTTQDDNRMRDGIISGRFNKFNRLTESDALFAGHSMWKYIADTYGKQSISNLIYMTRINRSIESSFSYVLGMSLKELSFNWLNYYQKLYLNADKDRTSISAAPLKIKQKPGRVLREVKLSPDGGKVAYVSNDIGKYRINVYDIRTSKNIRIAKGGYKSVQQENDLSVPLLAWHPSGRLLSYMTEKKGKIWFGLYTVEDRKTETTEFLNFDKVLDYAYSDNGQQIVLSGVQKGQSDIYVYSVRGRQSKAITGDLYDDLHPRFVNGSSKIIFSSNRSNDTLAVELKKNAPQKNLDLFLIDTEERNIVARRLTNTPNTNELQPTQLDSIYYSYLSDDNGIYNRYIVYIDSAISFIDTTEHYRYFSKIFPQTNYSRNVLQHDVSYRKNSYAELFFENGKHQIAIKQMPKADVAFNLPLKKEVFKTAAETKKEENKNDKLLIEDVKSIKPDTNKIDIGNYVFQSEFPSKKKKQETTAPAHVDSVATDSIKTTKSDLVKVEIKENKTIEAVNAVTKTDTTEFILPTQRNYDLAFSTDYFISQLDNSLFNSTYQTYTGGAVYFDPGVNGLFKVGMSDLFNDFKITGGFRFAGDFNSNEYLVSFEMLKRKIDRQFVFYRQSRLYGAGFDVLRVHTHDVKIVHKLPFNDLTAIKGTLDFRNDRIVYLSTDLQPLITPNFYNYWASAKLEYIFDNTLSRGLNLYNGMRYKFFAETFKKFNEPKTDVYIVGADFRYYLKVHRQIIWANRFSASTSFGKQKLLYYLGSEDNAIVPTNNFDNSISVDQTQNYAFQTLASPMRGFLQNIRNGNSFVLVNTELRIPVFQYIINRPIRSDFIRNFQVVGFADAGTAWTGSSPFGDDNSLNTQVYGGSPNPITVTVLKQIQPVVSGYGFGLRSRIFGYFIRADWAWGIDDKTVQKNIFYLSLGLDF